jgi:hypothetical protein
VTELPQPTGAAPFPALLKRVGITLDALRAADGGELLIGFLEAIGRRVSGR